MSDPRPERNRLGRGLSALMADVMGAAGEDEAPARSAPMRVAIDRIRPNPQQPRRAFPQEALEELAASIRERGVLQPLIVRELPPASGQFEIVAGERRWRAAQLARVHELPVIVRDLSDSEAIEIAIVENIQRADLNPIEEAAAYRQLMDRFGHTQERLAEALGKSRSHIANLLRLLSLPEEVIEHVRQARLSAGHARALVTLPDPATAARRVIAGGMSVRQVEALARGPGGPRPRPGQAAKDADTVALEQDLAAHLGMAVTIDHRAGDGSGRLTIRYPSLAALDALCRALNGVGEGE